jgi:hypothetical protein
MRKNHPEHVRAGEVAGSNQLPLIGHQQRSIGKRGSRFPMRSANKGRIGRNQIHHCAEAEFLAKQRPGNAAFTADSLRSRNNLTGS